MQQTLKALEFDKLVDVLVNLAVSEEGRERLSKLSPGRPLKWVREELSRIEEVRGFFDRGGSLSSGGLKDPRPILAKVSVMGSVLSAEELLELLFHLRVQHTTRRVLDRERGNMPLICRLARDLNPAPDLESRLEKVITPEATVRDNASPELSRLRNLLAQQQNNIRIKLARILPRLAKQGILRDETFSIRDGRYVLPVRSDAMSRVKGIVHDRSSTGGTLFVEPTSLIDLGNEIRALELAERDEVRRILAQLSDEVRAHSEQMQVNQDVMTDLDCVWAKARLAEKLDCCAPVISEDCTINILGGRHPLLDLTGEREVVPLTLELGREATTLVISGPNAGGKSVALKCVGLICVMAGCGLHVPGLPGTSIPLFRDIQADIGDQQSIADDLSTFTAHVMRLREILETADSGTLVLIDEIGAGTDPQEGSSLSVAVLEKLTRCHTLTIVTTHHGSLKAFAHSSEGCVNGSMEFDLNTFQPTYRFHAKIPGSSYALDIARRAGLTDDLIARAQEVLGSDKGKVEDLIADLSEKVRHYESLLIDEEQRTSTQKELEDAYLEKLKRLKIREKELKQKAREEAEVLLKEARRTVEAVVKEIREKDANREIIKQSHRKVDALRREIDWKLGKSTTKDESSEFLVDKPKQKSGKSPKKGLQPIPGKAPEVGDKVQLDDSETVGEVTAVSSRGDKICVAVGAVQLWMVKDRITVVTAKPQKAKPIRTGVIKHPDVPLELDIRGLRREEALLQVDRYLYDGAAVGRGSVGIIHGKGSGVLSRSIHDQLRDHPLVESFRFGKYGEGDYGITLVKLKS